MTAQSTTGPTANEQTITDNLIDTADSLASGLSARAHEIRQYYIEGASTQKALVEAYLNDMARSFREQADKALHYMNLADASDLGTRSVYYSAYEYYAREANRLLDPAIDAKARLDTFLEGTKAELSKILNAEAIAKLGTLFDAAQMIGAVAEGSVDRVGEVATGIVAAEALGSFGAFLGTAAARATGVPGIVGAGIGAFAGAFAGNQAADKFFQEIFKPLAEAIPISVWDKYFDLGLWAGNKIPIEVWDKLFGGFDYSRESVRALIDTIRQRFSESKTIVSPIVLDLNGDGIAATSVAGGVYFDHDADQFAERSGWVNTSDGLLVLDRNGNGVVDSGRELFGSETLLSTGSKAPNGFAALAELDSNGDALIDARDSAFPTLRVWRDLDQDGQSDAGELQTLADIVAFNRGQGADVVGAPTAGTGQGETNDTVSLAGIRYAELRLARSGNDLYVKVAGTTDSIRLTGWYASTGPRTVSTLQVIVDSTADYDAANSDSLVNRRIARLNFQALVGAFDAAYNANPSIGDWAIPPAMLSTALVASSDTDAIGGQLAYRYGRDGSLAGLDFATASAVLADANFGTAAQSIGSGPTSGGVRLARVSATAPETGELDTRVSTGTPLLSRTAPLADDASAAGKLPPVQGAASDAQRVGLPRLLGRWLGEGANTDSGFWLKRRVGAKLVAADAQSAPAIAVCKLAQPEADARVAGAPHSASGATLDGSIPSLPAATDRTVPPLASKLRPLTAAMVDAAIAGAVHWGATDRWPSIDAGPVERTAIADEGQAEGSSLAGLPRALARFAATDACVSAGWRRVEAYLRAEQSVGIAPTLGGEDLVDTGSLQQIGLMGAALAIDESQRSMRAVRRTMVA